MLKIKLFIVCLVTNAIFCTQTYSQAKEGSHKKIMFSSIQQFGLLGNEATVLPSFQLINGIKYNRLFAGIGIGIDPYFVTSFPLFLDLRYELLKGRLKIFAYGDIGINKIFHGENRFPRNWSNGLEAYKLYLGLYHDFGIGIKVPLTDQLGYFVSIGSSFKETKYMTTNYSWPDQKPSHESYRNIASRFFFKMGLQF